MHRRPLLALIDRYAGLHPDEAPRAAAFRARVEHHPDCFERTCEPGHVTASAWIASHDHRRFLLAHHRKLGRWLQLGGHADGDPDVRAVALREAREESGMHALRFVSIGGEVMPIDLDIHAIPERGDAPAHEHWDVRFLLVAEPGQAPRASAESHALRWFDAERLEEVADDESLLRLGRKARARLAGGEGPG